MMAYLLEHGQFAGIAPSTDNINRVANIAQKIDARLSERGLPLLAEDHAQALWCEEPQETGAMLSRMEELGLDIEEAREELAAMLPPNVRRHIYQGVRE